MEELIPTEGHTLVEVLEKENKLKGSSLVIPETAQEQTLGKGICRSGEHKGRIIYFKRYAGDEVEHDGIKYVIADDEYIIAYLKGSELKSEEEKKNA